MAWRSPGTGNPISFRCSSCRRADARLRVRRQWTTAACALPRPRGWADDVVPTGRVRPNRATAGREACSPRMGTWLVEYECSCGHRGWSAHLDLLQRYERDRGPLPAEVLIEPTTETTLEVGDRHGGD